MKTKPAYKLIHLVAAVVMFVSLAWLTVCLPYVYSFQTEIAKQESKSVPCPLENEESNPLAGSTEEKAPSPTPSEEYLHHTDDHNYLSGYKLNHDNRHSYDIYVAYHGEVQCPPPNFLS